MHKPLRHIDDPVTSVVTLLVFGAVGFFGLELAPIGHGRREGLPSQR